MYKDVFISVPHKHSDHTLEMYPFLKKYRSPLMEVAASNTRSRLHRSAPGFGRSASGSSGSGSGGGLGFGAVVGPDVRLPER